MKFTLPKDRPPAFWLSVAVVLIVVLGFLDYLTGPEIASSLFYLVPIAMVSWYVGRRPGIAFSFLGAAVWLTADVAARSSIASAWIIAWNAMVRLGFFLVFALLLSLLRRQLDLEKRMARSDFLTGAVNSRYFYELLEMEINRSQRSQKPFTVAYIDLDHFKEINDRLGHLGGDRVLKSVVEVIREWLRKTDFVARLGGDEFALLLPETGENGAREALERLRASLLAGMREHEWPVTFSIGAATFIDAPAAEEIVHLADRLMYEVKNSGRNAIRFQVHRQ